jgi:hypothetical protein
MDYGDTDSTALNFFIDARVRNYGYPGVLDVWELGWPLLRGDDRIANVKWRAD